MHRQRPMSDRSRSALNKGWPARFEVDGGELALVPGDEHSMSPTGRYGTVGSSDALPAYAPSSVMIAAVRSSSSTRYWGWHWSMNCRRIMTVSRPAKLPASGEPSHCGSLATHRSRASSLKNRPPGRPRYRRRYPPRGGEKDRGLDLFLRPIERFGDRARDRSARRRIDRLRCPDGICPLTGSRKSSNR